MTAPLHDRIDLERRILHGLACEWDEACAGLQLTLRRRLRRPLFALDDLPRRWGTWSRDRQEIRISRKLVLEHAWGDVRDVLLHEMAHQLADQALDAGDETPHGPTFRQACEMLGADPRASESFPTLQQRLDNASAGDGDREVRRIRKLLRLAGSSNRHEAEAAMLKAHELMARHTRDLIAADTPRDYMSVFVGEPALRHARSCYHLATLLRDFYFVLPVWVPSYVVGKERMGRVLEISGLPKNVQTARRVAALVAEVSRREWNSGGVDRGRRYDDFMLGIVDGLRSRLEGAASRRQEEEQPRSRAIQKLFDPKLRDYGRKRYGRLVYRAGAPIRTDLRALEAGRRIGRALVVSENAAERLSATVRPPQLPPVRDRSSSKG